MLGMMTVAAHRSKMAAKDLVLIADEQLIAKLRAENKRIVAEKDAEIAWLMRRLDRSKSDMIADAYYINQLRCRLAPFTKIRNRDSRGRFIKDTVA